MQNENIVRVLQVLDGERAVKASYFVEGGMIYAHVDGRSRILPIGIGATEESVRRLVLGELHTKAWRQRLLERWSLRL